MLIVEPAGDLNFGGPFKLKSVSIAWELMFTRSLFTTADLTRQHDILDRIAALVDAGKLQGTASQTLSPLNAENLIKAHQLIESGRTIGKLTIVR